MTMVRSTIINASSTKLWAERFEGNLDICTQVLVYLFLLCGTVRAAPFNANGRQHPSWLPVHCYPYIGTIIAHSQIWQARFALESRFPLDTQAGVLYFSVLGHARPIRLSAN